MYKWQASFFLTCYGLWAVEQITTPAVSPAAPSFPIFKAPRAAVVILLAPLRVVRAVSAVLVPASRGSSTGVKKRKFLLNVFSLQRAIKQAFRVSRERLRSGFSDPLPTKGRAQAGGPSNFPAFPRRGVCVPGSADSYQALLERIDLLEQRLADASIPVPHETDWIPLVKASVTASAASGVTQKAERVPSGLPEHAARDGTKAVPKGSFDLAARKVLCVGGKAALYPEYRCLVEASGATVFFYRSDPRPTGQGLSKLLAQADMVMCPVDCVNHEAYFTAKRYCKYSGKPCVLLDRSDLATFRKGVATLAELTIQAGDPPKIQPSDPLSPA